MLSGKQPHPRQISALVRSKEMGVFAGVDLSDIDLRILDLAHANLSGPICAALTFLAWLW